MDDSGSALSVTIDGTPDLPGEVLKALYRVTGRSTVELRGSILAGRPVYAATLFGDDHLQVVPRLEKTITLLTRLELPFTVHELTDAAAEPISLQTMREIIDLDPGTND